MTINHYSDLFNLPLQACQSDRGDSRLHEIAVIEEGVRNEMSEMRLYYL